FGHASGATVFAGSQVVEAGGTASNTTIYATTTSMYTYTTLDDPLATNGTLGEGINDAGQIVGWYNDSSGTKGFLYEGGNYVNLDDPSNEYTVPQGINAKGQIVGYTAFLVANGFLFSGGAYNTIDDPLATMGSYAEGINNAGQ